MFIQALSVAHATDNGGLLSALPNQIKKIFTKNTHSILTSINLSGSIEGYPFAIVSKYDFFLSDPSFFILTFRR
jgi:hypothetical protein